MGGKSKREGPWHVYLTALSVLARTSRYRYHMWLQQYSQEYSSYL